MSKKLFVIVIVIMYKETRIVKKIYIFAQHLVDHLVRYLSEHKPEKDNQATIAKDLQATTFLIFIS